MEILNISQCHTLPEGKRTFATNYTFVYAIEQLKHFVAVNHYPASARQEDKYGCRMYIKTISGHELWICVQCKCRDMLVLLQARQSTMLIVRGRHG